MPGSEIHYFAFFELGKEMKVKVSHNTLKILETYYQLKEKEAN